LIIDPRQLGTDIVINESGDLAVYGRDFDCIDGPDHVILRFARELMSPANLLSSYCTDYGGVQALAEDYGNEAFYQLSEPLDDQWVENVKQAIYLVGEAQPNLEIENIDYRIIDPNKGVFGFDISVSVAGSELKRLYLENEALGFNVRVLDGNRT